MARGEVLRIESADFPCGALEVSALRGREAISQLFDFEVDLVCVDPDGFDPDPMLGASVTLRFLDPAGASRREIHGMIVEVRDQLLSNKRNTAYSVRVVPHAHKLTLVESIDIFMDLTVPEVVSHKLVLLGLDETSDERLEATYPKREFVVQYKESDLAFVTRLLEHLGISFTFAEDTGGLIFIDHNSGFPRISDAISCVPQEGELPIHSLELTRRIVPGVYVVRDYNYRTPQVDLTASQEVASSGGGGGIIEYGPHFKTPDEGVKLAKIRAEELTAQTRVYRGESAIATIGAGRIGKLLGHPKVGDIELLFTEVEHELVQGSSANDVADGAWSYRNRFVAIPAATAYRPPRRTPKPVVAGVLTGIVDDERTGREKVAHLDNDGRYRIRFLFDMNDPADRSASRLIRMAQPHAGASYGMHFPLKPGVEVLIVCVNGDPDRPIIASAVPNAITPSPVDARVNTLNRIQTESGILLELGDHRVE
jgi:type VI secretion system secreted protein VgrG